MTIEFTKDAEGVVTRTETVSEVSTSTVDAEGLRATATALRAEADRFDAEATTIEAL